MLASIPSAAAAEVACPAVRGVAARATDLGGEEDESDRGTKPMGWRVRAGKGARPVRHGPDSFFFSERRYGLDGRRS